jgi:hypothetical protein
MSALRIPSSLAIFLAACLTTTSAAADFNLDVKADTIKLGAPILGPERSPESLKGHVVLLEYWGIH